MTMQLGSILFVAGAATHVGFFNRGEHHMYGNRYLQIFVCAFITISLAIMGQEIPSSQAFLLTATLAGYYLSGLYGSLITYRIFLSPIRMFPGPFWAKISNVTFSAQLRKGDYPKDFKRSIKNTGILSVSDHQIFLLFIRRLLMPSTGVIPDVSKPTGTISPYRWYRCRPPVNAQNMTKGAAFGVEHFMVPCYAAMRVGLQSIRTSLSSTLKTSKGEKSILPIYSSCIALML